jgi:hypothetical protein
MDELGATHGIFGREDSLGRDWKVRDVVPCCLGMAEKVAGEWEMIRLAMDIDWKRFVI